MKKYKFEIGQEVYIRTSFADETMVTVKKRKSKYGNFYLVSNHPQNTHWMPEESLHKFKMEEDPSATCSKNGCEIVNSFLEKTEYELLQEEYSILQERIDINRQGINFLTGILNSKVTELKMLEYDSTTVWNKIYNASEYQKEHILEMIQ